MYVTKHKSNQYNIALKTNILISNDSSCFCNQVFQQPWGNENFFSAADAIKLDSHIQKE